MAAAVIAATALAPAGAAGAATGGTPGYPCATESPRQVFAGWGDPAWYWLAPGGGFEEGAGDWSLAGGAAVVDGNSPFALGHEAGSRSLSLPRRASATSPSFCVTPDARVVRWVQRGPRRGALRVEVVHASAAAAAPGRVLRVVRASGVWEPSRKLSIPLRGVGLGSDGSADVALRFTAIRGRWSIDDVYIDPMMRR